MRRRQRCLQAVSCSADVGHKLTRFTRPQRLCDDGTPAADRPDHECSRQQYCRHRSDAASTSQSLLSAVGFDDELPVVGGKPRDKLSHISDALAPRYAQVSETLIIVGSSFNGVSEQNDRQEAHMRGRLVVFKLNRYRSASEAVCDHAQDGAAQTLRISCRCWDH